MKPLLTILALLIFAMGFGQQSSVDFDAIDSLIGTTPEIKLCKKAGKEDLRFMSKTPEKYSTYKLDFMTAAPDAFSFDAGSHFTCGVTVEVNCEGKAGNYHFAIEPRNFKPADFENFKQLIALVNKLTDLNFTPAIYLGENVNSKISFKLLAKNGKLLMQ